MKLFFSLKTDEGFVNLFVRQEDCTDEYEILSISESGNLLLNCDLPKILGLNIDSLGKMKVNQKLEVSLDMQDWCVNENKTI